MDSSIIAVRIANGTFVPVIDTSSKTRRRLVLTTVKDDQTSVRIDLFRGADEEMASADYVGSLMIENIEAAPKGEADIALLLGLDEAGNLNATATDKKSGEYQSLSVSLESLGQESAFGVPDFELSDEELTLDDLSMDDEEFDSDQVSDSLSLDDISLEEDLSLEAGPEQSTDTLAAGDSLPGLEEFSDENVSLDESFGEESEVEAALDAELSDEDFTFDDESEADGQEEITEDRGTDEFGIEDFGTEQVEAGDLGAEEFVSDEFDADELESEELAPDALESDELPDLGEGMVEAELGEEDFTFDETPDESAEGEEENIFGDPAAVDTEEAAMFASEGEDEDFDIDGTDFDTSFGDESGEDIEDDLSPEEFAELDSSAEAEESHGAYSAGAYTTGYGEREEQLAPRRSNAIVYVGYLVLSLAALGVLTYLVFRLLEGPPAPPLRASLVLAAIPVPWRRGRRKRRHSVR